MKIDKMIEEYKKISHTIFLNDDVDIKKKFIDKNNKLIKKVQEQECEQEFFEQLFQSTEPLILNDAAHDAFYCRYNIRKCLSIMEYLKENANNLVFCDDPVKDKQLRKYCSSDINIDMFRKEVDRYNLLNDDKLYRQYNRYTHLIGKHVLWLYNRKKKNYADMSAQIDELLTEINKVENLNLIFDIANKKYINDDLAINYLAINAYYACKYGTEKAKYRKVLEGILKIDPSHLTQILKNLIHTYLDEIDTNTSLNNE